MLVGGFVLQVLKEFFTWSRKATAKKRSPERSPLKLISRATKNVYEDSDSDKSEEVIL